ncbi:hypothetical protein DFH06DRAFT_1135694 [Mycena polygramma]|nr:hypothetical protein DFH06DRAFT_1135694 [Mycena polygramma]
MASPNSTTSSGTPVLDTTPPRPSRRSAGENPIYGKRNESGVYTSIAKQIEAMGSEALANLEYPDHITRRIEEWSGNYKYLGKDGNELRVSIIGEILGPSQGTLIRAQGNHYARSADKVKDTIALGIPTCASVPMHNTVLNQIIAANQITTADADEFKRKGEVFFLPLFNPVMKLWTKSSSEARRQHDTMIIHMQPKYATPTAAGAPKVERTAKRKLDDTDDIDAVQEPKSIDDLRVPTDLLDDEIKIGAFYEPALLPDFGGSYFNLQKNKLVQHDIRDMKGALIPPWKIYEALRPGTLVLVLITLHCFKMKDDYGKEPKECRSIRVLAESDEYVEPRDRPIAPTANRPVANLPGRVTASFDNFVVPAAAAVVEDESAKASGSKDASAKAVMADSQTTPAADDASQSSSIEIDDPMGAEEEAPEETPKKKTRRTKV